MERNHHHGGGVLTGSGTRFRHQRSPPSSERFLGIFDPPKSSSTSSSSPPIELSEQDIFSVPSGSSSSSPPTPHRPNFPNYSSSPSPTRHNGILAALNDNGGFKPRSGFGFGSKSSPQPVFNHKASNSLSSSASTSPVSSRILIPRRALPPVAQDRSFLRHQSAPINVPAAMQPRVRDMDEVLLEEEEEDEEEAGGGMILPPHELVDARNSPMLACSVLEGAGRTLKGRDLRQVRNAIWRKTGFLD